MAAAVLLVFAVRVIGGTILLAFLGAPSWALAAWLMLHISVNVKPTRRSRGGAA
jgi:hypothetical protein